MHKRQIAFIGTLLGLSAGAAQAADWTAAIGTGHAADSRMAQDAPGTQAVTAPALPHWSALIGTGHVAYREPTAWPVRKASPVQASPHWTSLIGSGHVMEVRAPAKPAS